ncbi:binding--dependent transport system inner membrane component family protein [Anoxybacillus sp. B7M1]|uniref:ABC transporter permease n=2 Tax=Bacillales TaxID=1385 RepID=A0ABD5IXQ6_9BACL|nr:MULTISPECIES: ABC transporter permease [Anoxybacillus]ANB56243.1 binding--dependent transport system inner membrane component family protein [Anoxybacillus sp. B2M1]ANB65076.1 binding--dependent transport system inner membrane component family protein [Anoxybacillus sp. B7M1]KXG10963.1 Dipeptide transport system permease protein DppB [Anoxybacillus sp. P3H1B]MBB3907920.1 peptide/nickel transport system permease protein [Anoxybacillus rupiensis]MBS2772554.1 ABC transporter permease [Anoxybac
MFAYTLRRILMVIPVLLGMSLVVFFMIRAIPGNPAQVILGQKATKEAVEALTHKLGLDQPWYVQYVKYLGGLLKGDLGESIRTGTSVSQEIWPYLAATLELSIAAMLIAIVIGVNAGIISAWFQNSWFDYTAMILALVGVSMPIFWLGLMEQWVFAIHLDWLPTSGREEVRNPIEPITHLYLIDTLLQGNTEQFMQVLQHLILPSIALATIPMAIIARITRSSMLEVMKSDYIRTARAKGLSMFWVVYKHSLKNAIIPVLTVIGLQTGLLLGGAILTETIFSWPGIGRYIYEAIGYRDYPVIQSGILVVATIFIFINLVVDLLYAAVDPRIKYN